MRQAVLQPAEDKHKAAGPREGRSLTHAFRMDRKARKAGMLNVGETLPAMVEVKAPAPAPIAEGVPNAVPAATFSVSIGKATLTLPSSMLAQVLRELSR